MILKKQDLHSLPLGQINQLTHIELEQWAQQQNLQQLHQWLLPQLIAHFGQWKLLKDTNTGEWDVVGTLKHNIGDDPKLQAIWKLSRIQRSILLDSQTKHPQYAQFTPLILAGFKLYKDVPYHTWQGLSHLEYLLEPKLFEAVNLTLEQREVVSSLGSDRLLEIRQQGLMNKSGKKVGELKSAESTWALTGIQDTELGSLPKLTQTMLCQIWIAHPAKRTKLMILDPINWDNTPKPLLSGEIFETTQQTLYSPNPLAMPWL